jgi:epoxide hydrolase
LPGYGFSDKPARRGWTVQRIAGAWTQLMARLGCPRYGAAGSDWGTSITAHVGLQDAAHVAGIHLVPPLVAPDPATFADLTDAERAALADLDRSHDRDGYSHQQSTRPQTIGYGLVDSPALLCAWIAEKFAGETTDLVTVPAGCSVFPPENPRPSRRWAARRFTDIRYWNEPDRGGHFAALEQPEVFAAELRAFFRLVR